MQVEMERLKSADIITAGFPCQDISYAGRGAGISGKRSGLWWQVRRCIRMVRPRFTLLENVAALLDRGMGTVLGSLAKIGYDTEWHCIPASAIGCPQPRDRVWILCHTNYYGQPASKEQESLIAGKDDNTQRAHKASKSKGSISKHGKLEDAEDSDYGSERIQGFFPQEIQRQQAFSWCKDIRSIEDLRNRSDLPTPLLCGNDNGIPDRIHRTKALGNAVVPQIPEIIGRAIMDIERN